ncbi:MAG: lipid-A-disaccharide synthase, partial [Acidobacteriota bacterium]
MKKKLKLMVVAGEASGDMHAAKLVKAIQETAPGAEFFGSAGSRMRDAGVEAIVDADGLSVIGIPEIARALPMFVRSFRLLKKAAAVRKPDAVIFVDFPDFNLKLARTLKKMGIRVIYYISPQLWAWRKYRLGTIRRYVDLMIVILPFEKDWYGSHGLKNVIYVGSPLTKEIHPGVSRDEFRHKHGFLDDSDLIALLPGSRHKEIVKILPEMLKAAALVAEHGKGVQFVIPLAQTRREVEVNAAVEKTRRLGIKVPPLTIVSDETFDAVNAADAVAVASGTATLETGIIGTPMVIVYKTSTLNYRLLRPLIDVEHFGLINLIAGKRVATELIQDEFTGETLAAEILRILEPEENNRMRDELRIAADKLGHAGLGPNPQPLGV